MLNKRGKKTGGEEERGESKANFLSKKNEGKRVARVVVLVPQFEGSCVNPYSVVDNPFHSLDTIIWTTCN
jgi:hypothetical protein